MASSPGAGKEAIRTKRKRNLPGMPDPDAEVIALSPKSLMETNKYVCDICGKGFQRDQNLQLHRRGHNLPWKLKQRPAGNELRKKVYVCPEPSCAHHDRARALGDLTGIKKHFCRKHGEKKFKCDKCSKCYAVLCDLKAHSKVCGTREYPCDCGTVFARRDSFLTHRAFCDALAQESARSCHGEVLNLGNLNPPPPPPPPSSSSPPQQPLTPSTAVLSPVISIQSSELPDQNQSGYSIKEPPPVPRRGGGSATSSGGVGGGGGGNFVWNTSEDFFRMQETECVPPTLKENNKGACIGFMGLSSMPPSSMHSQSSPMMMSLSLSPTPSYPPANSAGSMFLYDDTRAHHFPLPPPPAALSATALLQKAAEIGSKSSTTFLQGLGLAMSSVGEDYSCDPNPEKKPLTLDFLGVGGNQTSSSSSDQYPVLLSSMNNGGGRRDHFGFDASSSSFAGFLGGHSWDDTSDQKPAAGFL